MIKQKTIISDVQKLLSETNIQAIIQHGSSIHQNLVTDGSDIDLVVVAKNNYDKKIIDTMNNQKYHIDVFDLATVKSKLSKFEDKVCTVISDTNFLSGRLLSGKIILDDCCLRSLVKQVEEQLNNQKLILKFYLQSINFMKDFQYQTDEYTMKIIFDKALDSLGTALLLKNKFYNLNPKHQIKLLKNYLNKQTYEDFINLRFNFGIIKDKNMAFQRYKTFIYNSELLEEII